MRIANHPNHQSDYGDKTYTNKELADTDKIIKDIDKRLAEVNGKTIVDKNAYARYNSKNNNRLSKADDLGFNKDTTPVQTGDLINKARKLLGPLGWKTYEKIITRKIAKFGSYFETTDIIENNIIHTIVEDGKESVVSITKLLKRDREKALLRLGKEMELDGYSREEIQQYFQDILEEKIFDKYFGEYNTDVLSNKQHNGIRELSGKHSEQISGRRSTEESVLSLREDTRKRTQKSNEELEQPSSFSNAKIQEKHTNEEKRWDGFSIPGAPYGQSTRAGKKCPLDTSLTRLFDSRGSHTGNLPAPERSVHWTLL